MNIAIILSGGVGSRMGADIPKQYIKVNEKPVIVYCIESFLKYGEIHAFIIALDDAWKEFITQHLDVLKIDTPIFFSAPGETRQHTIYNALKQAKKQGYKDDDIVVIHDAVRPLVSTKVIKDCLDGCIRYDAVIATIDVKDTIYVSRENNCITDVPERNILHAGQTPEAFKLGKYLAIHDSKTYKEISSVTGGAEFAFRSGMQVFLSKGEEINFKLTTPNDLYRLEQILNER